MSSYYGLIGSKMSKYVKFQYESEVWTVRFETHGAVYVSQTSTCRFSVGLVCEVDGRLV